MDGWVISNGSSVMFEVWMNDNWQMDGGVLSYMIVRMNGKIFCSCNNTTCWKIILENHLTCCRTDRPRSKCMRLWFWGGITGTENFLQGACCSADVNPADMEKTCRKHEGVTVFVLNGWTIAKHMCFILYGGVILQWTMTDPDSHMEILLLAMCRNWEWLSWWVPLYLLPGCLLQMRHLCEDICGWAGVALSVGGGMSTQSFLNLFCYVHCFCHSPPSMLYLLSAPVDAAVAHPRNHILVFHSGRTDSSIWANGHPHLSLPSIMLWLLD